MAKLFFVYLNGCAVCTYVHSLLKRSGIKFTSVDIVRFVLEHMTPEERQKYGRKSFNVPILVRLENNVTPKVIDISKILKQITDSKQA